MTTLSVIKGVLLIKLGTIVQHLSGTKEQYDSILRIINKMTWMICLIKQGTPSLNNINQVHEIIGEHTNLTNELLKNGSIDTIKISGEILMNLGKLLYVDGIFQEPVPVLSDQVQMSTPFI